MSPAGGRAGRSLRGSSALQLVQVVCTCGETYEILPTAARRARCPRCKTPTRDLPTS